MERLNEIRLEGLLPEVFAGEGAGESEVWRRTLTFRRGTTYMIEAASGAGKSSLCSFIYGARSDYQGTLTFDGTDAGSLSIAQWQRLRRESLAYLPQEPGLFGELTAMENIELKRTLTGDVSAAQAERWMKELGVDMRRDYKASKLSVGQQQRVALIRSLCQPFDFLLLDEPVSHLDEANNRLAASIILSEARRREAAVIATSVGNPLLIEADIRLRL